MSEDKIGAALQAAMITCAGTAALVMIGVPTVFAIMGDRTALIGLGFMIGFVAVLFGGGYGVYRFILRGQR